MALALSICLENNSSTFSDRFLARCRAVSKNVGFIDPYIIRPACANLVEELVSSLLVQDEILLEFGLDIIFFSRDLDGVVTAYNMMMETVLEQVHMSQIKDALFNLFYNKDVAFYFILI